MTPQKNKFLLIPILVGILWWMPMILFFFPAMVHAGYQPPMPLAPGEPENGKINL